MTRRNAILIGLLILLGSPAWASTGTLMPSPYQTLLDSNGNPVSNGKVCTYTAGTTTPATTYSDVNLTTPNANPIRTDTAGRFVVFLSPGSSYKFVYQDASGTVGTCDGATIKTVDNVSATPSASATVDVTGTAGEAISAGQCVYLSSGSGGKVSGQWYKCDSANDYSSSLPEVGLAPSGIASAASGTIRLTGTVNGLSSLSAGSVYYVGSSGALTATKPATGRAIGYADSATTLILTANPPQPFYTTNFVDDFRLSVSTNVCVPSGDVTAATTLYLTPCTGNRITLFDTNGNPTTYTTNEISIAVPATTSQMYDVFAIATSGAPALELLAWTNDTTRATALVRTNGRWTKSGDPTRLYVGSFRTAGVSGQTEDSTAKRYVWSYYNRVRRNVRRIESAVSWTYATATWHQANANTANQVEIVVGVAESTLDLTVFGMAGNGGANENAGTAIGEDATNTYLADQNGGIVPVSTGATAPVTSRLVKYPAIGRHVYAWIEIAGSGTTLTFYGSSGLVSGDRLGGLIGWIEG